MSILLALVGCVVRTEEEPDVDGSIEVGWEVGAAGCEAAGVETVTVTVDEQTSSFACADGVGSVDVAPGQYLVTLEGLDADGHPRYGGEGSVSVGPGEVVTLPTVVLSALPASLTVTWYFENGRLCGSNGVEEVDLRVFEDDYLVDEVTAGCDDGAATIASLPAGTYDVGLYARDADGVVTFSATEVADLGKGDDVVLELQLVAE